MNKQGAYKKRLESTSAFIGVHWKAAINKWQVAISYKYKHIYVGVFDDEVEAAMAYDEAAKNIIGKNARCNFS